MQNYKPKTRNLAATAAIMRKGGAHQESRSGLRQSARQELEDALEEFWHDRETEEENESPVAKASGLFLWTKPMFGNGLKNFTQA